MEPPSQVISQVAGVGSDDPLSRLYTDTKMETGAGKGFGRVVVQINL